MQSPYITIPPPFQSPFILTPRPTPNLGTTDWALLTQTDQASNAVVDTGAFLTASSFTAGTGAFSMTVGNTTTRFDGSREACPGWTMNLRTLYPYFDPAIDEIHIYTLITTQTLNTGLYGFQVGLTDNTIANRATWNAAGIVVVPSSATVIQGGLLGGTVTGTLGNIGTDVNPVSAFLTRVYWYTDSGLTSRPSGQAWRTGADETVIQGTNLGSAGFDPTVSLWRLSFSMIHNSTTAGTGSIIAGKIYHRLVRSGPAAPS